MRVIIDFEFSDEQREDLTKYHRKTYGTTGLPKLATRQMLREFVELAISNRWMHVDDELDGRNDYPA